MHNNNKVQEVEITNASDMQSSTFFAGMGTVLAISFLAAIATSVSDKDAPEGVGALGPCKMTPQFINSVNAAQKQGVQNIIPFKKDNGTCGVAYVAE